MEGDSSAMAQGVRQRGDNVTYSLLAEVGGLLLPLLLLLHPPTFSYFSIQVNTFHEQRVIDIKSSHQHFLQEQIKFYQKVTNTDTNTNSNHPMFAQITEKLQETLRMYDQC